MSDSDPESVNDPAGPDWFLPRLFLNQASPEKLLADLVAVLDSTPEPDGELCVRIGAGNLESLLRDHERQLWPQVEELARTNPRFRRALSAVWAYDSSEFDRREALLEELREHWTVSVSFVVEKEDFNDPPLLSWRALEVDPPLPDGQLPRMLRQIADREERTGEGNPEWVRDRAITEQFRDWSEARSRLDSALHELTTSPSLGDRKAFVDRLNLIRSDEESAWTRLARIMLTSAPPPP